MSTLIHDYGKVPEGYDYTYGDVCPFDEYDLKNLYGLNIDEVWYWYATAPYEGSGNILMRKGDLYDIHTAGHCSCYGPTEDIEFNGKPLDEVKASLSESAMIEYKPLIEMSEAL